MLHLHLLRRLGGGALLGALVLSGATAQAQPTPPPAVAPSARAPEKAKAKAPALPDPASAPSDAGAPDAALADAGDPDAALADAALADAALNADLDAAPGAEAALPPEPPPPPAPPSASLEPLPPPPPPPPASAPVLERGESAAVRIGDTPVLTLYAARGEKAPEPRARAATKALAGVIDTAEAKDVRVTRQGDIAVVMVGQTPILQLGETDAKLAGDSTLDVHGANVAAQLRRAIEGERRRAATAQLVFSISLVVFFALIAVYLMRKVGELADRLSRWLDERGEKALSIRVRDIEVLSPATLQSSAIIAVGLGKWLGQFGIFYTWLVVVLSLFEATRGYTQRLTGFVLEPLSQMMTRLATSLPLLVILVIAGLAVAVLVRFVGLFFRSVERRETVVPWVPAELAGATSVVIRLGIVLLALVLAGPVLTGDDEGALARLAQVAVAALGLATVPLLANGLVGAYVVFGRRLRVGQHVEVAGRAGRVSGIDLMEVRLEEVGLGELRFPHLFLLRQPTRVFGLRPRVHLDVFVAPEEKPLAVLELLERVALRVGRDPRVELAAADARALHYRITLSPDSFAQRSDLSLQVLTALRDEEIKLGHSARRELSE